MNRLFVDMMRYGAVSVLALVVDFGTLMLLANWLQVNYLVAATIAFLLGLITNYALSHNRVFTDPKITSQAGNFAVFATIGVIGLLGNNAILWLGHQQFGMPLTVAKCIAVAVVFFWNFLARRQFLYQGHKTHK